MIGMYLPGAPADITKVDQFTATYQYVPKIISWYLAWGQPLNLQALRQLRVRNILPLITLEPWDPRRPKEDVYPLDNISRGKYDTYLAQLASTIRTYGHPVLIRFAHEMNGDWYPWSGQPQAWVNALAQLHLVFHNVENVFWIWCPNVSYPGSRPLVEYYPGDRYIDWVGLDGYNWGNPWVWPSELFGPSIQEIRDFTTKPLLICETACAEHPDKDRWINALRNLRTPLIWFDEAKERDWRINSSEDAQAAFQRLINRLDKIKGKEGS